MAQCNSPSDALQERQEVLATLVDAYVRDRSLFLAIGARDGVHIQHPGLSGTYSPEWSHVEALAADGLLNLREGRQHSTWTIGIPSRVLQALEQGASAALSISQREERIDRLAHSQVVVNVITGGIQNIAQQSSNVAQSISQNVKSGDLESLLAALRALGIEEDDVADLEAAIREDERETGRQNLGPRAAHWLGDITTKALTQGATTGLVASADEVPGLLNKLQGALGAFFG